MEEAKAQPRIRLRAVIVGVVAGLVVVAALSSVFAPPEDCGSGDWPAFAMSYGNNRRAEPTVRIMWCLPSEWTVHTTPGASTTPEPRAAQTVFSWFNPVLPPNEAWRALAPGVDPISVQPQHRLAKSALRADTADGVFSLEFTGEGIPVRARTPGPHGIRFWVTSLDRANLPIQDNDALLHYPLCESAGGTDRDSITNAPCWSLYGRLLGERCPMTFSDHTSTFVTASCSL